MGQYYIITNKTKKEYLCPHTFNDGLKLMEFSSGRQGIMQGLALLLAQGNGMGGGDYRPENIKYIHLVGSWANDKVSIVGDYFEDGKHYELARKKWKDISKDVLKMMLQDYWVRSQVKKDLEEYGSRYLFGDYQTVIEEEFPEKMKEIYKREKAQEEFRKRLIESKDAKKKTFS